MKVVNVFFLGTLKLKFGNTLRTIYFGSPHTSRSDMFYLHFERRNRKRSIQSEKYVSKISGKDENKTLESC